MGEQSNDPMAIRGSIVDFYHDLFKNPKTGDLLLTYMMCRASQKRSESLEGALRKKRY